MISENKKQMDLLLYPPICFQAFLVQSAAMLCWTRYNALEHPARQRPEVPWRGWEVFPALASARAGGNPQHLPAQRRAHGFVMCKRPVHLM